MPSPQRRGEAAPLFPFTSSNLGAYSFPPSLECSPWLASMYNMALTAATQGVASTYLHEFYEVADGLDGRGGWGSWVLSCELAAG